MLAAKDAPARLRVPLDQVKELHHWLIDAAAVVKHIEPAFLHELATSKLRIQHILVWLFTVQIRGGFTAMAGVNERRSIVVKTNNQITTKDVIETRWIPFSSQLRINCEFVGSAGTIASSGLTAALRELGGAQSLIRNAVIDDFDDEPHVAAVQAWRTEASALAEARRDSQAEELMQGDVFKNIKFNVDTTWQPSIVAIEVAHSYVGRGCDVFSSGDETFVLGESLEFPTWGGALDERAALVKTVKDVEEYRRRTISKGLNYLACGAVALSVVLDIAGLYGAAVLAVIAGAASLLFRRRLITLIEPVASIVVTRTRLALVNANGAVREFDGECERRQHALVVKAHAEVDRLYAGS